MQPPVENTSPIASPSSFTAPGVTVSTNAPMFDAITGSQTYTIPSLSASAVVVRVRRARKSILARAAAVSTDE